MIDQDLQEREGGEREYIYDNNTINSVIITWPIRGGGG